MWYFLVCDPKIGARLEVNTPTGRPYLMNRWGTWVHHDDLPYLLDLAREGCCGKGMVKPAYHLAIATAQKQMEQPENPVTPSATDGAGK